jgi:hypothetical protein
MVIQITNTTFMASEMAEIIARLSDLSVTVPTAYQRQTFDDFDSLALSSQVSANQVTNVGTSTTMQTQLTALQTATIAVCTTIGILVVVALLVGICACASRGGSPDKIEYERVATQRTGRAVQSPSLHRSRDERV